METLSPVKRPLAPIAARKTTRQTRQMHTWNGARTLITCVVVVAQPGQWVASYFVVINSLTWLGAETPLFCRLSL
jgi:hypothetical protein